MLRINDPLALKLPSEFQNTILCLDILSDQNQTNINFCQKCLMALRSLFQALLIITYL